MTKMHADLTVSITIPQVQYLEFTWPIQKWIYKADLYAKRVGNTSEEFNMSAIELASALTNPQHVG
jgi:hypothetical protein